MNKIKRYLYQGFGFFCVGMAYIGFVTPGIPFSIFLVMAAWAFAKSSPKMEAWLYNHPWFGKFLTNWNKKRIFPTRGKFAMVIVMASTLAIFPLAKWLTICSALDPLPEAKMAIRFMAALRGRCCDCTNRRGRRPYPNG